MVSADEMRRLAAQKRADAERARRFEKALSSSVDRGRFRQAAAELESEADTLEREAENSS